MAKFKIHIIVVTVTMVNSFMPINEKSQMAIDPLIAQSKIAKLGIIEAKKYIQNIKLIKVK